MQLVLNSIYLVSIIFLIWFVITNFLELIKKDSLKNRIITACLAIVIFIISIPELILQILTGHEYYWIIIIQLVLFAGFSFFHSILVCREIKRIKSQTYYSSIKIDKNKVEK